MVPTIESVNSHWQLTSAEKKVLLWRKVLENCIMIYVHTGFFEAKLKTLEKIL